MIKIVLLGTGNVAKHLFKAIHCTADYEILQVFGRNSKTIKWFSEHTNTTIDPETILDADLYIISVSDDAISDVASLLTNKKGLVVHTSGSQPLDCINHFRRGVFYPLQTFTANKEISFSTIPICLEADSEDDFQLLYHLGNQLSKTVQKINSKERSKLHLAAVFANNFSNHMYNVAADICEENKVSFDLLKPLILETAAKLEVLSPYEAQTGPARRNDKSTIKKQLEQLTSKKHKKLYKILSKSIKKNYGKKL